MGASWKTGNEILRAVRGAYMEAEGVDPDDAMITDLLADDGVGRDDLLEVVEGALKAERTAKRAKEAAKTVKKSATKATKKTAAKKKAPDGDGVVRFRAEDWDEFVEDLTKAASRYV